MQGPHGFNIPLATKSRRAGSWAHPGIRVPPRGLLEDFKVTRAASARQDATFIVYEVVAQ